MISLTFKLSAAHPNLHSFPTRRSSDLKDIIIRKGENISAKEVEDLLYTHPKVADVAVIGLPDANLGERCCAVGDLRRSEEHTSELQSRFDLVCRLLLEKKKK